ncbi:LysE family translocator [Lampropedia aestuarii]|uniref:LysE family translocator n=1 Tax=Lampropedia aestuarii TaxID=2562762 RepID=A0A4S5C1M5_9BURK|nr:LysE family translocator [Lampropedia aestuarii]MDH5856754.1 LysE family translocator [Lampropedia aestuarii]THJ36348.1 LysE family translocator [Lampropedia aestuarii]
MPSIETTTSFMLVIFLLGFTPGPDNTFVLMQSISRGRRAGFIAIAGFCVGICVHTAAVALGLAALVAASAVALTVLKIAGAVYLGYLAWQAFHAPVQVLPNQQVGAGDGLRLFMRAIVMNLSNPKLLLFFVAFLPQFVDSGAGPVELQVAWFGLCFVMNTVLVFGTIVLCASWIGRGLRQSPRAQRYLNRACGVVFAALGGRLLASA